MNRHFLILTGLIVVLICGIPVIAPAQLFDEKREGLILGGGVGYEAVHLWDFEFASSGFTAVGKIGYGVSSTFSLHLAMHPPNTTPRLRFNYFANPRSPLYVHGALGYASTNQDSNILISGGLGYEFSKYLFFEEALVLNRHKGYPYNQLTVAVSLNFTYY